MEPFDGGKYRRPHYSRGDRVRLLLDGPGWNVGDEVEVTAVDVWQTLRGQLADYVYTVRLPNGVTLKVPERGLAPLAQA